MGTSKSSWEVFFKEAGIPSKLASDYATIFCDNRMRLDMLDEINKELLHELGVKAVGDTIAILRYAKVKQKELSRHRSQSPEVEVVSKKPASVSSTVTSKSSSSNTTKVNKDGQKLSNISMTVKAGTSSNKSSGSSKSTRKTLSDRFNDYEKESKIKKLEGEEKEVESQQQSVASVVSAPSTKTKPKTTVFTIQLPKKKPQPKTTASEIITTTTKETDRTPVVKQKKVTLVPAQGKPLNRNKQSTSIFDRLDRNSSSSSNSSQTIVNKTVAVKPKQDVFSRLGKDESDEETSAPPKNVFSRLGDR